MNRRGLSTMLALTLSACGGGGDSGSGGTVVTTPTPAATPPLANDTSCVSGSWTVKGTNNSPVRYESDHFAIRSADGILSTTQAQAVTASLEKIYQFYLTVPKMPDIGCALSDKTKVNVEITPTMGVNAHAGVDTAGLPYINIDTSSMQDDQLLAHELTHVFQASSGGLRNGRTGTNPLTQWFWESHANWMSTQMPGLRTQTNCAVSSVDYPHLYLGSTRLRYCNWTFWEYLKDKYGYAVITDMWTKSPRAGDNASLTADPFTVLMNNNNWTLDQLNDLIGDWASRNVTWDYTNPDGTDQGAVYRTSFGRYVTDYASSSGIRRLVEMMPIDLANRRFAVPPAWAPQRWGYNLIRLVPDAQATSIAVRFRGIVQASPATTKLSGLPHEPDSIPQPSSGWRWRVVVIDAAGKPRYSDLKQTVDDTLSVPLSAGDQAVYLVVVGAPTAMQQIRDDQPYYSLYRFPYMVQLTNAMPQGYEANAAPRLAYGHVHPNGGGWVGSGAQVDASAFVGPYARVVSGAVRGNARIEGNAVIYGGTVSDNAVVGGMTILGGVATRVRDNAQANTTFEPIGSGSSGLDLSGTAQLTGDVTQTDVIINRQPQPFAASTGFFSGYLQPSDAHNADRGAALVVKPVEVTAVPGYQW